MRWRTISTANAVINSEYTLIKNRAKYFPSTSVQDDHSLHESTMLRIFYRRFMRLRPFVSNRRMVRDTYTDYLRYKFKVENYELKRSIIFSEPPLVSFREELWNSLAFIIKAVSYLPETKQKKWGLARDNTMCRQVFKNLLTLEFEKQSKILRKGQGKDNPYADYRLEFNHIRNPDASPAFKVFGEYDICLLYLNRMLRTRL